MELLFAVLGGLICGGVAHVILPWRSSRGILLPPAIGGVVSAVVWEVLTWLGWPYGGTWIWVVALVAAGVVALVVERVTGPRRVQGDQDFFDHVVATGQVPAGTV